MRARVHTLTHISLSVTHTLGPHLLPACPTGRFPTLPSRPRLRPRCAPRQIMPNTGCSGGTSVCRPRSTAAMRPGSAPRRCRQGLAMRGDRCTEPADLFSVFSTNLREKGLGSPGKPTSLSLARNLIRRIHHCSLSRTQPHREPPRRPNWALSATGPPPCHPDGRAQHSFHALVRFFA